MSTSQTVEITLTMRLSSEEVEMVKGWIQNPIRSDETLVEANLRALFFNALSNPGELL